MATGVTKSIANHAKQIKQTVQRLNVLTASAGVRGLQLGLELDEATNNISIKALSHKVEENFLEEIEIPDAEEAVDADTEEEQTEEE